MKLLLLCFLILLSGCHEEKGIWSSLTNDERTYLQNRAAEKCRNDAQSNFEDLATTSNNYLVDFERGDYWKVTVSDSTTARNLRVWKVDGNNVYFLYYDPSVTSNKFIKMTTTENSEMFEFLRTKKCETTATLVITQSSTSVTVKRNDIPSTQDVTSYSSDFTYTGTNKTPAFFAAFSFTEKKEKLDSNNNVVSTENLINKIEYIGKDTDVLETSFTSYTPRRFCIYEYSGVGTSKLYTFPFKHLCTDDNADGANPNSAGDSSMDFTSAEL